MNGSIRAKLNLLTVVDSVPGTTTTRTHFLLTTSRRSTFPRVIILNLATIKKNHSIEQKLSVSCSNKIAKCLPCQIFPTDFLIRVAIIRNGCNRNC